MDLLHTDVMALIINRVLTQDMRDIRAFAVNHRVHVLAETLWRQLARSSLKITHSSDVRNYVAESNADLLSAILERLRSIDTARTVLNHGDCIGDIHISLFARCDAVRQTPTVPIVLMVGTEGSHFYISTYSYRVEYYTFDDECRVTISQNRRIKYGTKTIVMYRNDTHPSSPQSRRLRSNLDTLVRKVLPEVVPYAFPY